jgi:hypothetical protein
MTPNNTQGFLAYEQTVRHGKSPSRVLVELMAPFHCPIRAVTEFHLGRDVKRRSRHASGLLGELLIMPIPKYRDHRSEFIAETNIEWLKISQKNAVMNDSARVKRRTPGDNSEGDLLLASCFQCQAAR